MTLPAGDAPTHRWWPSSPAAHSRSKASGPSGASFPTAAATRGVRRRRVLPGPGDSADGPSVLPRGPASAGAFPTPRGAALPRRDLRRKAARHHRRRALPRLSSAAASRAFSPGPSSSRVCASRSRSLFTQTHSQRAYSRVLRRLDPACPAGQRVKAFPSSRRCPRRVARSAPLQTRCGGLEKMRFLNSAVAVLDGEPRGPQGV